MTRIRFGMVAALALAACGGGNDDTADDGGDAQPACGASVVPGDGQVRTTAGVIQGARGGATWSWKGVPYAAPPVGALRYRPPEPAACREGVSDAVAFAPQCPQLDRDTGAHVGNEDCLYLNVWAPDAATPGTPAPVMVFIHGGGHQQGSTSQVLPNGQVLYDGAKLAVGGSAVVVTVDYRLGPFGFFAHPALSAEGPERSGNYGMLDQIAALRWVRDNITAFGGDPARVLVFGESAGAVSVCRLIASPLAAGLFTAAAIESGACVARPLADAEAIGTDIATEVGCSDAACLRAASVDALLATVDPLEAENLRGTYDGVIDGYALLDAPLAVIGAGAHNRVPTIIGTNSEEQGRAVMGIQDEADYEQAIVDYATLVLGAPNIAPLILAQYPAADYASPRAAMVAFLTDVKFACPTRKAARALAGGQAEPVYRYVFSKVQDAATPQQVALGAFHGLELFFLFDALGDTAGPNDRAVIEAMQRAWGQLAATGMPGDTPVTWPPYAQPAESYLWLDDTIEIRAAYRNEQCDFLESLGGS